MRIFLSILYFNFYKNGNTFINYFQGETACKWKT